MINNIETYLTYENIYLLANWGVLPFWIFLIIAPNNSLTKLIVHSIIAPLLLGIAYVFVAYKTYLNDNIFESFNLYFGLENLYTIFSKESANSINSFFSEEIKVGGICLQNPKVDNFSL